MLIREFERRADLEQMRDCVIELQESERRLDPRMPCGEAIADAYLIDMQDRCSKHHGRILVADVDGRIAGFVMILTEVQSGDLDDGNIEFGLIADLVVREAFRGKGLGRKLVAEAESVAGMQGVHWLRIRALAENKAARALYSSAGYAELYVDFEKDLSCGPGDT